MNIVAKSEAYVTQLMEHKLPENLCFHNLQHTKEVVHAVELIAQNSDVEDEDLEILKVAAWFHDVGFVFNLQDHEAIGQQVAQQVLQEWNYPDPKIEQVVNCIAATRMPQCPQNLLEEIICDADLYHLSQPYYWKKNSLLLKELCECLGVFISDKQWYTNNLSFLREHHYFTPYARLTLEKKKKDHIGRNIRKLLTLTGSP